MTGSGRKASLLHAPLLVFIIACQFAFSYAGTPVVIWCPHNESFDHNSPLKMARSNPLQKLSSEEFEEILSQTGVTEPTIVVADELCVEDLKNNKVLSIATNGSKLYYFPHVLKPITIFEKIYSDKQIRTVEDINDDHELNMVLKDTDSNDCIALTGKQCRYSQTERIKREAANGNDTTEFKIKTDKVLFYSSKSLYFMAPENPEKTLELPASKVIGASTHEKDDTLILTIKFSNIEDINNLMLDFSFPIKSMGYYTLNKISYDINGKNGILSSKRDINFPKTFSYHCSLDTIFTNDTVRLSIKDMQVQVGNTTTFSDAYDCVGFTSIPIWTGIFVTAILALIMIWALTMIMDIRTMDRFDDPKGKAITISAAE
ncbi:hypothetical protein ACFW04_001187 [Cataglyphis niger]